MTNMHRHRTSYIYIWRAQLGSWTGCGNVPSAGWSVRAGMG